MGRLAFLVIVTMGAAPVNAGVLDTAVRGANKSATEHVLKNFDFGKAEQGIGATNRHLCASSAVTSSFLKRAEHCAVESAMPYMTLQFNNGAEYRYFETPRYIYDGLISASSPGRFFNSQIRNRFPCQRLGTPLPPGTSRGCE